MGKKILIVDDEETSRKILGLAFEGRDHTVIYGRDGEEAVEAARRERPDLVILDIDLPKMNGYEAARQIKASPGLEAVPVVAITARTVRFSEEMARQAGCDEYLTKPFRLHYLRERLARFL